MLGSLRANSPTVKTSTNAIVTNQVSGIKDASTFARSYIANTRRTVNETAEAVKSGYMSGKPGDSNYDRGTKLAKGLKSLGRAAKAKASRDIIATKNASRRLKGG